MPLYSVHSDVISSKPVRQFKKYILRRLDLSSRETVRLFHSRAQSTVELRKTTLSASTTSTFEERSWVPGGRSRTINAQRRPITNPTDH